MKKVRLGDIADIVTGSTPSMKESSFYDGNDICFFKPSDISDEISYLSNAEYFVSNGARSKCRMLPVDSILVTCIGSIGKVAIIGIEATCNQQINAVLPNKDKFYSKFLAYSIFSQQRLLQRIANAPVVPIINKKDFSNIIIPYTNLHEQSCIIERLDKVCESIRLKKQQLFELNNLVKSQFIEMFGDAVHNERHWITRKMCDVAPSFSYKGIVDSVDDKYWLLNLDMVEAQTGQIISKVLVPYEEIGNSTAAFCSENVLYSKLRPYLNKVVVPVESGYATSELIPLKPNKGMLNKKYFAELLRSNAFVSYIQEKVAGAKMPRVSMDVFRQFAVMCPPIELQNQFANFVEQVDKSKFTIQQSLNELENCYKALMQEYFG